MVSTAMRIACYMPVTSLRRRPSTVLSARSIKRTLLTPFLRVCSLATSKVSTNDASSPESVRTKIQETSLISMRRIVSSTRRYSYFQLAPQYSLIFLFQDCTLLRQIYRGDTRQFRTWNGLMRDKSILSPFHRVACIFYLYEAIA